MTLLQEQEMCERSRQDKDNAWTAYIFDGGKRVYGSDRDFAGLKVSRQRLEETDGSRE